MPMPNQTQAQDQRLGVQLRQQIDVDDRTDDGSST